MVVIGLRRRYVIQTIFIFVSQRKIRILLNPNRPQASTRVRYRYDPAQSSQVLGRGPLEPDAHLVAPVWNIVNLDIPGPIRKPKIRRINRQHNRAHIGVNVAKQKAHSQPIKQDRARRACLVEAEIKTLSIE